MIVPLTLINDYRLKFLFELSTNILTNNTVLEHIIYKRFIIPIFVMFFFNQIVNQATINCYVISSNK